MPNDNAVSTTHLLSPCSGTSSTELLGLHPPGVGNEKGSVVSNESLLQFEGGSGILVLGVETGRWSVRVFRHVEDGQKRKTHATIPLAMACRKAYS